MLDFEVLVSEFDAVDRFSASSIPTSEVTPLDHEAGDDPVE